VSWEHLQRLEFSTLRAASKHNLAMGKLARAENLMPKQEPAVVIATTAG
jgi:hypothetical protein